MEIKKTKSLKNNKTNKVNKNKKTQKGGRSNISNTSITYNKGSGKPIKLECFKCRNHSFIAKTLTLGTKTKAAFGLNIFNNRFKVFTCNSCGFVQLYSNNIKCDGKKCD